MTYYDDAGRLCSGADFILNRLPLAQAEQYRVIYWNVPRGMNPGFACKKVGGSVGSSFTV